MFTPEDLSVRPLRAADVRAVVQLVASVQRDLENRELRAQIKHMFLHPAMWVFSGVVIATVGISMNWPPLPTAIVVLLGTWMLAKKRFQAYWSQVRLIFSSKAEDLTNLAKFYKDENKRVFLVAEVRGQVVGTVAIREHPDLSESARTCKLFRLFVAPAFRRMGIASKLISEAMSRAKAAGYQLVRVRTHETNAGAVKCYLSCGLAKTSEDIFASSYPCKMRTYNFEKNLTV